MTQQIRRRFTPQEKVAILRQHLLEGKPVSDDCDSHGLKPRLFTRWQKEFFENGAAADFEKTDRRTAQAQQRRTPPVMLRAPPVMWRVVAFHGPGPRAPAVRRPRRGLPRRDSAASGPKYCARARPHAVDVRAGRSSRQAPRNWRGAARRRIRGKPLAPVCARASVRRCVGAVEHYLSLARGDCM